MWVPIAKAQKSAEGCLVLLLWQVEASVACCCHAKNHAATNCHPAPNTQSDLPRPPSRCSDKESICQGRGHRFHPWPGNLDRMCLGQLTHGPQPLSLRFRGHVLERLKPALLEPELGNKRRHRHGKPELHAGSSLRSPQLVIKKKKNAACLSVDG